MQSVRMILSLTLAALACVLIVAAAAVPQEGSAAPGFSLPSQEGTQVSLADFKGQWVVLYFYPKDFTQGCTIEAHNFQAGRFATRTVAQCRRRRRQLPAERHGLAGHPVG